MKKNKLVKITAVFLTLQVLSSCSAIKGIRSITDKSGKEINSRWAMYNEVPSVNDYKFGTGVVYGANYAVVDEAIEDGSDINHLHMRLKESAAGLNTNAIDFASHWNSEAMERYMILKGADVNYTGLLGESLLASEAGAGRPYFCDLLLKHGAKIDNSDIRQCTPLEEAVMGCGNETVAIQTATLLMQHGAKITDKTLDASGLKKGSDYPCSCKVQRFVVQNMIAEGEKPNLDPTVEAAVLGDSSKVAELIKSGKLHKQDEKKILFLTAAFGSVNTMKLLESKGLNLQIADSGKRSLLYAASVYNNPEMVKYLISKGLDCKKVPSGGKYNAVAAAVDCDASDAVKYYFQNVPNVTFDDIKDHKSASLYLHGHQPSDALYLAAKNGDMDLIDFMLDKGFPLNETTLSHAVDGAVLTIRSYEKMPDVDRQLKVIQHLLDRAKERNVSCDLSYFLSLPTNFKTVKFFVEHGTDINRSPKQNPISSALDEVDTDDGYNTIKYLIQKGANVNAHEFNGTVSATLMQCAIKRGRIDVIQLLVDHGANLEMEGGKNVSPLQSAIESGSRTVVEYLLKKGAKTDHGTSDGYTPLAYATNCGWIQDVKLLLKYGANKNIKGRNGKTAYDVAKANNDKVMMGLLK